MQSLSDNINQSGGDTVNRTSDKLKHNVVFVSHGSPTLVIDREEPAHLFLQSLGKEIGRPDAIVCISAHWEARVVEVNTASSPGQIYDFGGFSDELYQQIYHPPGSPELAEKVLGLLKEHGIPSAANPQRGLDHGAWCPLQMMYPDADVPVVQVSLVRGLDPQLHLKIGEALSGLLATDQKILILASGGVTHNLGEIREAMARGRGATPSSYVPEFTGWVEDVLTNKEGQERAEAIAAFAKHPAAKRAHPRAEHFLPLIVAAGVKGTTKAEKIYDALFYDLSLACYAFPLA